MCNVVIAAIVVGAKANLANVKPLNNLALFPDIETSTPFCQVAPLVGVYEPLYKETTSHEFLAGGVGAGVAGSGTVTTKLAVVEPEL
jgi:hypothetical protein